MSFRDWKHGRMAGKDDPRAKDMDRVPGEIEMCFIVPPTISSTPHLQLWDPAGLVVNDGDELEEYAIDILGTAAVSNFVAGQEQAYWFELELRPSTEGFSGMPTHASGRITIRADSSISFPQLRISDLVPNIEYSWVARLATQYCHCTEGGVNNRECTEHRLTAGHWIHGGRFRTGPDRTWRALSIQSVHAVLGTVISGDEESLLRADSNYYEVDSTLRHIGGLAIHMAELEVRFTAVPRIRHLRITFVGHSSRGSEFSLLVFQDEPPMTSLWVSVISNSPFGSADQTFSWTTEPSPPENIWWWIDGNGLVSVRLRVVARGGAGPRFATDLLAVEALAPPA